MQNPRFPGFYICICRIACLCPQPYLSHGLLPAKHPPRRHGFQLPVRRVSEAGASELAVPSTKACHTHGSAGVGRGGCFAGTSPGISPGITLGISPFSRCRQFGTPENQKIRGGGDFMVLGTSGGKGVFTAPGVHTDSDAAGSLMGLPLGGLPGTCGFRGFLNFRRLRSPMRPHGIRGHRRLRSLGRSR